MLEEQEQVEQQKAAIEESYSIFATDEPTEVYIKEVVDELEDQLEQKQQFVHEHLKL